MKNTRITIKDIATALKVSPSTVSRALKNSKDISKETRQLVNDYAKEHHYKLNILAANLRTSSTRTIGVIVPQFVHFFFSSVLSGIEEAASRAGYNIFVAQSNEEYEKEAKIVHQFLQANVCGVIASLAKDTTEYSHFKELIENNIPIVFYDRICTDIPTERVVVDDYTGAFSAVEYMIQTGCKRIYFYSAPLHLEIAKNRRNGYLDAMHKYNMPISEDMIVICDTREEAITVTPAILEKEERPDAFFAINDETATGILQACKEANLQIPEDVSICGFTDGIIAQSTTPKLTTVEQRGSEVGESAIAILLDKLEGNESNIEVHNNRVVKTNLIVRGTTR